MATRKVLVCSSELLLGAGIRGLLDGEEDLEGLGVGLANEKAFFEAVNRFQPDIVLIDKSTEPEVKSRLMCLLQDCPHICVILLSGKDNWLHVFHRRDFLVNQTSDLVNVIRSK